MKSLSKHWLAAAAAFAVTTVVSSLFWCWFVIAGRYRIFLYNHLGAAPFDERTRSRYWMSGLVAAGIVLLTLVRDKVYYPQINADGHRLNWESKKNL